MMMTKRDVRRRVLDKLIRESDIPVIDVPERKCVLCGEDASGCGHDQPDEDTFLIKVWGAEIVTDAFDNGDD